MQTTSTLYVCWRKPYKLCRPGFVPLDVTFGKGMIPYMRASNGMMNVVEMRQIARAVVQGELAVYGLVVLNVDIMHAFGLYGDCILKRDRRRRRSSGDRRKSAQQEKTSSRQYEGCHGE